MLALKQRLKELDRIAFEDLCFQVLKTRFPTMGINKVAGDSGDQGVDVFAGQLEGQPWIWQCKHFVSVIGNSQKGQIKKSLRTALKNFRPACWVLCLPIDLDIKAHRWFDRLKESYKHKVAIGLFQGSDIQAHLLCNRPLLNAFFPGAIVDAQELKALALHLEEYTLENLSHLTAENAEEYLQRLRDLDPRLAFRVTFPPIEPLPATSLPEREVPENLLLSVSDERKTLDIYAADIEALAVDPPSFSVRIIGEGISKFQDAIRTGTEVSFGPDEVDEVSSSLKFLLPQTFKPSKFVLGPSVHVKKRRFALRVTISAGTQSIVYELVEFKYLRAGTEEVELVSCDPSSPLEMSFTMRRDNTGRCRLRWSWQHKEVQSALKAAGAIKLLAHGGAVELYDLKKGERLLHATAPVQEEHIPQEGFVKVLRDVAEISKAFDVSVFLRPSDPDKDERALALLLKIIREGRITLPAKAIRVMTFSLQKHEQHAQAFRDFAERETQFRADNIPFPISTKLFGTTIHPGICTVHSPRTVLLDPQDTLHKYLAARDGSFVKMSVKPLDCVQFSFPRFVKPYG